MQIAVWARIACLREREKKHTQTVSERETERERERERFRQTDKRERNSSHVSLANGTRLPPTDSPRLFGCVTV